MTLGVFVATALTACGIETPAKPVDIASLLTIVATALTACGIETICSRYIFRRHLHKVATALTACGIETPTNNSHMGYLLQIRCNSTYRLRY